MSAYTQKETPTVIRHGVECPNECIGPMTPMYAPIALCQAARGKSSRAATESEPVT